jgi:glycerol-3-phosphate acyltransferase PlsY
MNSLMETLTEKSWLLMSLASLAGYLIGSISFARIVTSLFSEGGKVKKIERKIPDTDITLESDTVAATSVTLNLGKKYGCFTAVLDMIKVALIVWFFLHFFPDTNAFLLTAMFGMLGHVYPIYHRFKGGRGQSPLLGALVVINWFGVLIANFAAVVLGYLTGSVLVMRWGWMVLMIGWFALYFRDPYYVAYIFLANILFFFSMRKELATGLEIGRNRESTQEEVSEFMLMGKGLGRFIDRYGLPALIKKAFGLKKRG